MYVCIIWIRKRIKHLRILNTKKIHHQEVFYTGDRAFNSLVDSFLFHSSFRSICYMGVFLCMAICIEETELIYKMLFKVSAMVCKKANIKILVEFQWIAKTVCASEMICAKIMHVASFCTGAAAGEVDFTMV